MNMSTVSLATSTVANVKDKNEDSQLCELPLLSDSVSFFNSSPPTTEKLVSGFCVAGSFDYCPTGETSSAASTSTDPGLSQHRNNGRYQCSLNGLKLFIGQIPRQMTEADILPMFEEFGAVSDLLVLRDKLTGIHKGCAFVTFCDRDAAQRCQEALHEKKILPGVSNTVVYVK
ncbi:unnamed protein product [Schistocephalus solidus]|uniref:RRM domain-containing protein n=1 Tax=Schistocephalus solidus TaxID=70667 RepID=A0A183SHS4_SCHSO|nr:unnamed protein product [Schistocephalus solidus]